MNETRCVNGNELSSSVLFVKKKIIL